MPSVQRVNWAKLRVLCVGVAAVMILGTISYLLTGGSVLQSKTTLYLYLDDATGLAKGSPVRVDGIGVGKVALVELSGSNQPNRVVRVLMNVERDRLESITTDSTAQVTSDNPIGDKFVDVTSGVAAEHLPPGGEIQFKSPSTELMKSIDIAQFQQRVQVIEKLLDDIEQGRSPLGQFIAGDEMYNQVRDKIRALQTAMHTAADTTSAVGQALYTDSLYRQVLEPLRSLDRSLAKLQSGQGAGQMLRDSQQYDQARAQVASLRRSIGDLQGGEMMNADRMYRDWTRQVVAIIQSVNAFNAGPMLTTSAVYDNFNGMAKELQGTMKDFRENPRKFLRLKIF